MRGAYVGAGGFIGRRILVGPRANGGGGGAPSTLDPATLDYQTRVSVAGGTVSGTSLGYLDTYIKGQKAAGLWAKKSYLWIPLGDFVASQVPIIVGVGGATITLSNIISGNYSETGPTGGYKGNGTNKYFDTAWNPILAGSIVSSFCISLYKRLSAGSGKTMAGNGDAATNFTLIQEGSTNNGYIASSIQAPSGIISDGMLSVSVNGSRSQQFYTNGSPSGTPVLATAAFSSQPLYGLTLNLNGSASQMASCYICSLQMSTGLSSAENLSDYNLMQSLQSSLTRQA